MVVISLISVNIIPVVISGLTIGFTLDMWRGVLKVLPLLWVVVLAVVMLTRKPAMWLTGLVVRKGDSFRAHIFADTLCSVTLISVILTIVGAWIGTWSLTTEPLRNFFHIWPSNFMIALVVEALLAQPVARLVMRGHHRRVDLRSGAAAQAA
ncbi:hypothetical protein MWU75_02560 [Ornithinimicrobium sp. F0845]|uniref:hypothetical protein n=1 Tax=Ornithinimicrobium sp. F0845 TaxID=2926412 RepID=UPI001FF327CD|nr:hypothetical protein [Ornithinimicrobium sp. F0845]MCK0111023.1 hypothetical protein [Ornithinimicrobium sp. F0845]